MEEIQAIPLSIAIAVGVFAVAVGGLSLCFLHGYLSDQKRKPSSNLPPLPGVPGLPLIGNLLQLKEKKPHKTFTKWAETYGPIYSIRTGATTLIVLNSNDVVKEATVTRFSSISTRKLSTAIRILSSDKAMVAVSDYDEFHKTVKRHLLAHILGPTAQKQKRHRIQRDTLIENTSNQLHTLLNNCPLEAVNLKEIFESELFGLSMKQTLGEDVESIHVDELGITMSRHDIFKCLVHDPMEGGIEVDWRDFFPYLKWIPNTSFDKKIQRMNIRREAVMKSLIQDQQRKPSASNECYLDYLLSEAKDLSDERIQMLLWEVIIETSDTTLVATEWAMYELAKDSTRQDRLYMEISRVCGPDKITEENLPQLPYLYAVFQETLRLHSPVPIIPLRYVHEDTELGGYFVPSGSEIAINIYGCNMDKKVWEDPEQWKPERFLGERSESMDLHKTMAFGGGKRVCAGALEAMTISRLAIGRLIQEFEWKLKDGDEDDVNTLGLTARKLHPMLAFIKPRN